MTIEPPASHAAPRRIVLVLPCCIGDVVLATATLAALRRGYPDAHITWAVGRWSKDAIANHPLLDAVLDTGPEALPVRSPGGFLRFVRQMRAGHFDLAVSLVRSPLMSLALLASGIPRRAGLDSGGRGFGYTVRARVNPDERRHEAEVYLDVARALGLDVAGCHANVPVTDDNRARARALLAQHGGGTPYIVLNPQGGRNPGMEMDIKRWPPENFAALANRLAPDMGAFVVVLQGAGPGDQALAERVLRQLTVPGAALGGDFPLLAALAHDAALYVGNDTGVTHLAAAAAAAAVMIMGPTDPARYAPFAPNATALWKPFKLPTGGVAAGAPADFDWSRDGISVDEAEAQIRAFLSRSRG